MSADSNRTEVAAGPAARTPAAGADAWSAADPTAAPAPRLAGHLRVTIVERRDHGWTRVRCENGWETWVDGRVLEPVTPDPIGEEVDIPPGAAVPTPLPDRSDFAYLAPPPWLTTPAHGAAPPAVVPEGLLAAGSRRSLVTPIAVLVVLGAIGAMWLDLRRNTTATWTEGLARGLSGGMLVLMIVMFVLSLRGVGRPAPTRDLLQFGRAVLSLGATIALGSATRAGLPVWALPLILAIGIGLGTVEGATANVVTGADGVRYGRRPFLPMVTTFVGLFIGVAAALGDVGALVAVGQAVGLIGTGLMLGVPIGRGILNQATVVPRLALAALLVAALSLPGAGSIFGGAEAEAGVRAGSQATTDGNYFGELELVNPAAGVKTTRAGADLVVEGDKLTGVVAHASEGPDGTGGFRCDYLTARLDGSETTAQRHDDGSLVFTGNVKTEIGTQSRDADPTCSTQSYEPGETTMAVTLTVKDGRLRGPWGTNVEVDAEDISLTLPPDSTTTTSGGPTATVDFNTPRDPNTPVMTAEPGTIPPTNAADAAILVLIGLVGSGVLSAADAEKAQRRIVEGEIPADVLDELARDGTFGRSPVLDNVKAPTRDEIWASAQDKLNKWRPGEGWAKTVTSDEYREWLTRLERQLPDKTWKQIVAAIHWSEYNMDATGTLPGTSLNLFEHGPETDGYQDVMPWLYTQSGRTAKNGQVITNFMPKFVIDKSGNKVDISHAIAGLRSDLNRGEGYVEPYVGVAWRNFMRGANTNYGDTWQTIIGAPMSSWRHGQIRLASEYAPPNQRLGNDAGLWLSDFYRVKGNENVPLSDAMGRFFHTTDGLGTVGRYYQPTPGPRLGTPAPQPAAPPPPPPPPAP